LPSTYKTDFLELNKWVGEDKPRMDDFNADNLKIDSGAADLNHAITAHAGATTPHMSVQDRFALEAAGTHAANATMHMSAQDRTNLNTAHTHVTAVPPHFSTQDRNSLNAANTHVAAVPPHLSTQDRNNLVAAVAHMATGNLHMTQAERTRLSNTWDWHMFAYPGNGAANRSIALGFRPSFGIVFGSGVPLAETNMHNLTLRQFAAMFSTHGVSRGVTIHSNGIEVQNFPAGDHLGNATVLNMSGVVYTIIAVR